MTDSTAPDTDLGRALLQAASDLRASGEDPAQPAFRVLPLLDSLGIDVRSSSVSFPAISSTVALPDCPRETSEGRFLPPVGRYLPTSELGRGGMGRVLEARDPELCRTVAVKVVLDPDGVTADRLRRFVQEAQVTSQLEHPGIVPVHDLGVTIDGLVYYVMKRVEGDSLRSVLRRLREGDAVTRERWTRHRLLTVFVQICQAVAYAHSRGVLHRDLKPENVMLGAFGEVQVMDWGLARLLGDAERHVGVETSEPAGTAHTRDGAAMGTPGYMSPEQVRGLGALVDERSDVWSLGAILYELLTWERAVPGTSTPTRLRRTIAAPLDDPRHACPEMRVPEEIARVCMRALALDPRDRCPSAAALGQDVEGFLEGSRRREAARERLCHARTLWAALQELAAERRHLQADRDDLEARIPPWAPLGDPLKARLLGVQGRLADMVRRQATGFSQAVAFAERALSQDPENTDARTFLAAAWWSRFEDAERSDDPGDMAFLADRVREYDPGPWAALLKGTGALTLRTDPPGARVLAARYRREGLVWELEPQEDLGIAPLTGTPLEMGSYLLTLRAEGRRDTLLPLHLGRQAHWGQDAEPIPLLREEQIGQGWLYVPPGPAILGASPKAGQQWDLQESWLPGFLIARFPVTAREYAAFLSDLAERGDPALPARIPRMPGAPGKPGREFWPRPEVGRPVRFPVLDPDGDAWQEDWPVFGIDWPSAMAFAAWRAGREGLPIRLQSEQEYEKAARGADGRLFPWGNLFDAALCKMQLSRQGRPQPEPVGSFPRDRSPCGACDMSGGIRQWCREPDFDGDGTRRPIRGGAWSSTERACRAVNRFGLEAPATAAYLGFRLTRELTTPKGLPSAP